MTVVDAARILRRRWYVCLACLLLTAGAGIALKGSTVYWTQTDIRLIFSGPRPTNSLIDTTDSVIATAGLLVSEVNSSHQAPRLSTNDVSIVDAGINDGLLVRLPNAGGQWATNFNEPRIDVQASGSDPEDVRQRTAETVNEITRLLAQRQADAGVARTDLIEAIASPGTPVVMKVHGSRSQALVAIVILGFGLAFALTLLVDQWMLRVRSRTARHRPSRPSGTARRPPQLVGATPSIEPGSSPTED